MAFLRFARDWVYEVRHRCDIDRCGYGTEWGCKRFLAHDATGKLLMNAREPMRLGDNGHVTFHAECFEGLEPGLTTPRPRTLHVVPDTQGDDRDRHSIGA